MMLEPGQQMHFGRIKACPHWRRKQRLSQKSATVAEFELG